MPRHCTRFSAALAGLLWFVPSLTWLGTVSARAYDDQASLDLAAGYVHLADGGPVPSMGADLSLGGSYGLGDMFVARASIGYGLQISNATSSSIGRARAEVAYLLDVLTVVPFFGVGASAWLFQGAGLEVAPAGHGLIGADVLVTREWNVGIDIRLGLLLHSGDTFSLFESQLRLSRMFDLL